jgi:pimeloyl-ACP methyl ester carboxylesterase
MIYTIKKFILQPYKAIFINHQINASIMQKKILSFDKTRINYEIRRVSEFFLIFVHGLGGDLNAWKKERQFFHKKGFSTLAVDLRGHGLSGRPDSARDYRLENFAKDLHIIIKKEKISKFIIIGHCFGGIITIEFHKLFPELSRAYILIDTTYKAPQPFRVFKKHPFFTSIINYILENKELKDKQFSHVNFEKFVGTGDWNIRRIYSDISHTSFKSWLFTFQNIAGFDGIKVLKSIKKPVLVIGGLDDTVFSPKIAKKIHKIVRSSNVKLIPHANHILVLNNVDVLVRSMLSYIEKIEKMARNKSHE